MLRLPPVFFFLTCGFSTAGDWPNWRGPHFDGSSDETNLPDRISLTENIRWKVKMPGPAASTPVVSGDRVFVSTTDEAAGKLLALCFDRASGKELWRKEAGTGFNADDASNFANPSPVTDGRTVIFHFANGDTSAFAMDGRDLWQRNMQKDYGQYAIQWTPASSPVITDGLAIFQVLQRDTAFAFQGNPKGSKGSPNESYLLALDPATGKEKWRHVRPSDAMAESRESFSTPMPWTFDGRTELLVTGGDCISGHDLKDGRELWRWGTWNPDRIKHWRLVPGPVAGDGIILACAPKRAPVYAVKAGLTGALKDSDLAWVSDDKVNSRHVSSDVSTPLFYKGRFYILNSERRALACVEPKSGKLVWEHRIEGGDKIEASPTAGDDKIYFQDMRARLTIMAAGDKPKVLSSVHMNEGEQKSVRSSIALAGGCAFIRTRTHLYCAGR